MLILSVGCNQTAVPTPPPAPIVKPLTLADFHFKDASLEEFATEIDRAASKINPSSSIIQPFTKHNTSKRWESLQEGNLSDEHTISLSLSGPRSQVHAGEIDHVNSLALSANYAPSEGWGAVVYYYWSTVSGTNDINFSMSFKRITNPLNRNVGFSLSLPDQTNSVTITKQSQGYQCKVSTFESKARAEVNEEILVYLSSPETFRDLALKQMDLFEAKVYEDFESGDAWFRHADLSDVRADNPPRYMGIPKGGVLPKDVKDEAIAEMLEEIENRRLIIRENYQELYDAAKKAFPLHEIVQSA